MKNIFIIVSISVIIITFIILIGIIIFLNHNLKNSFLQSTGASKIGSIIPNNNAISRTVQSRLNDSINILDFGSDPTGVKDSYNSIKNAVLYLTKIGGGILLYPSGTYIISNSIPDIEYVTHQGMGIGATTVKATGNFPVFSRPGTEKITINGGGIWDMTIKGGWNQAGNNTNINAKGISVIGSNGALYKNLRFLNCYCAIYLAFNYESRMNDISILGQGTDQNFNGVVFEVTNNNNVNNAMYMQNVVSSFTANDGWRIYNGNGSDFINCSAEANGGYGFIVGSGIDIPCQFMQFSNCTADTSTKSNWLFQGNELGLLHAVQINNCWAGTANEHNWAFVNCEEIIMNNCSGYSAQQNGIFLNNSAININNFLCRDYNKNEGGFAGINIYNTNGINIMNCDILTTYTTNGGRSIDENGTTKYSNVQCNNLPNGCNIIDVNNSMFRNNKGFITEASGSVVFSSSSVDINHGLSLTPRLGEIMVTSSQNCNIWVTNVGDTTFTINVNVPINNLQVGWRIALTRYKSNI